MKLSTNIDTKASARQPILKKKGRRLEPALLEKVV